MATLALTLAGCQHIPRVGLDIKPSKAEIALIEENKRHAGVNAELQKKLEAAELTFKTKFESNLSLASANVWAALDTLAADPLKNKYTLAAIPALEVAKAASPQPTVVDLQKANESQRKMLSEQAAEIAAGKAELEAKKLEALASKEAQRIALEQKAAIEKAKTEEAGQHVAKVSELQEEKTKEFKAIAAANQKRLDDEIAKKDNELKTKLMYILVGLGIIAAVISFVIKAPGSLFNTSAAAVSAGALGLGVAIAVLPTWAWITGLGVLFGGIIWAILHPLLKYKEIAKVGVGAIQEQKDADPEHFKANMAAKLKTWTGGKASLEKSIDKFAEELNVK